MTGKDGDAAKTDDDFVLKKTLGGGPHGVGDPDDQTLRRAEREILIPQKMKQKAKTLLCSTQVKAFGECAKAKGLMMPFQCRSAAKDLENCLLTAYKDPEFINLCTIEYLKERTEFRKTGVKTKERKKEAVM